MFSKADRTVGIALIAAAILLGFPTPRAQASRPADQLPGHATATSPGPVVIYSQPASPAGGLLQSSLRDPDGSDTDQWAWDGFTIPRTQVVTEIAWRGGYDPIRRGSGGPVVGFIVSIYASIPSGSLPDIVQPPLARHEVAGNAGETPAAVLGGVQTYDYRYVLPAPFQVAGGTKYWVQIEAFQAGAPDWGLAKATGGDGIYFRRIAGEGMNYQLVAGDVAFALLGPRIEGPTIYLPLIIRQVVQEATR